ncbi:hypothetical protein AHiyo8_58900 [Arthrobacter sp. Hiyo8]|uniref:hypothetical protein n=1 Tax=Arthrobacter sp. Hiyo1 TaxID=1588020 RepID=UPI000683A6F7|nr:hypothetical protein [Arthrobacter sp. Hiyo1]BAS17587.1 hypothetical protein AHiyo8_58900 [Arthrobacter sp. Hiyo8]GAP57947.1 hypothetical protein AHiyo1_09090 [Arthrobacter sp. Hiyo1]
MERDFKQDNETNSNERTITTMLGSARIAVTSRTAEEMTVEVRLELETGEHRDSWYVVTPPQADIEETLAYRDACEALGMDVDNV